MDATEGIVHNQNRYNCSLNTLLLCCTFCLHLLGFELHNLCLCVLVFELQSMSLYVLMSHLHLVRASCSETINLKVIAACM